MSAACVCNLQRRCCLPAELFVARHLVRIRLLQELHRCQSYCADTAVLHGR